MNGELLSILEHIEREKGISREILIEAVEAALVSAAKKVVESKTDIISVNYAGDANNDGKFSSYVPEELGTIILYEVWDADDKSVSTWVESEDLGIR